MLLHGAAMVIQLHVRLRLGLVRRWYERLTSALALRALPPALSEAMRKGALAIDAGTPATAASGAHTAPGADALAAAREKARELDEAASVAASALRPRARRLFQYWMGRHNPMHLVRSDETFLSPLILRRRRLAAISLQAALRRYQAVKWRRHLSAARMVHCWLGTLTSLARPFTLTPLHAP